MNTQANKPATLSGSLIAVKGHAAPAVPVANVPPVTGQLYFKAMTLKLDRDRFTRLKQLGLDQDKTSQHLLVEAVDLLLARDLKPG